MFLKDHSGWWDKKNTGGKISKEAGSGAQVRGEGAAPSGDRAGGQEEGGARLHSEGSESTGRLAVGLDIGHDWPDLRWSQLDLNPFGISGAHNKLIQAAQVP